MSSSKTSKDKYLFHIDDYKVIRCVKRGGFGVINLVKNKKTGEEYATKTNLIQTKKQNKLFISREVCILIQIQHPTIIQFRGFSYLDFENKKNITILMDYMKEGSLADLIDKEMKGLCPTEYDNTKRQIILAGIARGMMILHDKHVIHRDLKPENILLDINFYPHITDFGLSKFFDPLHSMNQSISNSGSSGYKAPEVISSERYNSKADVYAFGILMYEIITGQRAYQDSFKKKISEYQLGLKVTQGFRPKIEGKTMKKSIQNLIEKCWAQEPKERPTFREIFKKLSLSRDDFFIELEKNNFQSNLIVDENENEEEEDEDEEGLNINKKYCLENVDFNEFLNYIDEINEEPKSFSQNENETHTKSEEIDHLKGEIKKLKEETESFSQIEKETKTKNEEIQKLKDEIKKLKDETKIFSRLEKSSKAKNDEIDQLKGEIKQLKEETKSFSQLQKETKTKDEEIQKLKDEIKKLKEETKSSKTKNDEIDQLKGEIEQLKEETKSFSQLKKETTTKNEEIQKLKDETNKHISTIQKLESEIESIKSDTSKMTTTLKNQNLKILSLEAELNIYRDHSNFFSCEISLTEPGILKLLKEKEKNQFEPLFIASQSSNDIYNIINPYSNDKFSTSNCGDFFIQFEIKESIVIKGIEIFSANKNYPKSFDIEIEGKIVKSIKEANELNGKLNSMKIKFNPIRGKKISFIQTGPNWDENNNFLNIKRIELISEETEFPNGVFNYFINQNENHDPHKCPVKISSTYFDFNDFFSLDATSNIWTFKYKNSWFQVELTHGFAILSGMRIKNRKVDALKNFKIICSNDASKVEESWVKLIEINEESDSETNEIVTYKFPNLSPPTKFIKLVQTGPNMENEMSLTFIHLDFFGCYL